MDDKAENDGMYKYNCINVGNPTRFERLVSFVRAGDVIRIIVQRVRARSTGMV